jgi:hypothetical protein
LAVSDRHIALVASAIPAYCAPVSGDITPLHPALKKEKLPPAQMTNRVKVTVLNPSEGQQWQSQSS